MNYLIVNPGAGNAVDATFWRALLEENGVEVRVIAAGPDTELPRIAADDRLIIAGGDGTVSRYAVFAVRSGCTLGVLPAGTGNDFARGLGIPLDPAAACRNLRTGYTRKVDVGVIDDGLFLNVAHIGFGAEVTRTLQHDDKHWWGRFAYLRTLFDRVRSTRGFRAGIRAGARTLHGRWLQISVANGRSFGGGQQFFDADPFDGQLDLVAVRPQPLWVLSLLWLTAWARRKPPRHEALVRLRSTGFEILGDSQRPVTADGELCARLPVNIGIRAAALHVILPAADGLTPTGMVAEPAKGSGSVSWIRSKEQAKLSELLAAGRGLLLRYEELRAAGVGHTARALAAIIETRGELLDRLESRDRARGDLPPAGDHEVNQLNALIDGLVASLFGDESLRVRLLRAEDNWKQLLDSADDCTWRDEESAVLDALRAENDAATAALLAQSD